MDYEKAYREAKLRMSAAYNSNRCTIDFMNEIFPKLKESNDERIRKEIIDYIKIGTYKKDWIAWLEKQGEKPHGKSSLDAGCMDNEHWQDVRERAAIAAMQGTISILSNSDRYAFRDIVAEGFRGDKRTYPNEIAGFSVACANALIEELKLL